MRALFGSDITPFLEGLGKRAVRLRTLNKHVQDGRGRAEHKLRPDPEAKGPSKPARSVVVPPNHPAVKLATAQGRGHLPAGTPDDGDLAIAENVSPRNRSHLIGGGITGLTSDGWRDAEDAVQEAWLRLAPPLPPPTGPAIREPARLVDHRLVGTACAWEPVAVGGGCRRGKRYVGPWFAGNRWSRPLCRGQTG